METLSPGRGCNDSWVVPDGSMGDVVAHIFKVSKPKLVPAY